MDEVPGGKEEMEARLKRLIELNLVAEKEAKEGPPTKEFIANVLYRIYKDIVPYKGSIEFSDTKNPALNWAGEVGLPYFLSRQKNPIYPNQEMIMPDQYFAVIHYAYLYLPRKKVGNQYQYNTLDYSKKPDPTLSLLLMYTKGKPLLGNEAFYQLQKEYEKALPGAEKKVMEVLPKYVSEIRQEVLKPRLSDWKRDVLQNPSLKTLVASYQKTKNAKTASAILNRHKSLFLKHIHIKIFKGFQDYTDIGKS